MNLLVDTNVLACLCRARRDEDKKIAAKLSDRLQQQPPSLTFFLSIVVDHELRRLYLSEAIKTATGQEFGPLKKLDCLRATLPLLELPTEAMDEASRLWAQARSSGKLARPEERLDWDSVLAAQALLYDCTVLTRNKSDFPKVVKLLHPDEL